MAELPPPSGVALHPTAENNNNLPHTINTPALTPIPIPSQAPASQQGPQQATPVIVAGAEGATAQQPSKQPPQQPSAQRTIKDMNKNLSDAFNNRILEMSELTFINETVAKVKV